MPWDCSVCGATAVLDDATACPGCGGAKQAWTMHANKTRTFRTTARKEKLELLRGEGDAPDAELVPAERAVSLPKRLAKRLAAEGRTPTPLQSLVVRLHPKPGQDPSPTTTALFDVAEVVPVTHPREPLAEPGSLDVWFVLVHGPEPVDFEVPGRIVLDVTESTAAGHAPQLGVAALAAKRKDLPIEPWPEAHLHAKLVRAPDGAAVGPAQLAWEKDGQAIEDQGLPATVAEDGLIRTGGLPWGDYTVQATLDGGHLELERVALPLLAEPDPEPHVQWVRARAPFIHVQLTGDHGPVGPGALAWERDGAAVTQADLGPEAVLPASVDADGVVVADRLPWGSYSVQVTLHGGDHELDRVALPLQLEPEGGLHPVWVRGRPVERGHIHARLLRAPDGAVVGPAQLSWEKDGAAVTRADLGEHAVLPTKVGQSGTIRAHALPWGAYAVRATPKGGQQLAAAPLPLMREDARDPHLQWVR